MLPARPLMGLLLLTLALPVHPALAASKRPPALPGSPPVAHHGRLLPVLPDGMPIEPSTDRAEFTESPDTLEQGRWDWNVDLIGGAMNRVGSINASTLEVMHAELQRNLGSGLDFSARVESWTRTIADQADLGGSLAENGFGPTVLLLREHLVVGGTARPSVALGARLRLPGASAGPGTHEAEGGIIMPIKLPLGEDTRLGATEEADLVSNPFDTGRHLEAVSSLELSHDIGERLSVRCESVGVWYAEAGRPWLGTLNAGISADPLLHVTVTLGASGGLSGGVGQAGWFGRLSVHS